MFWVHEFAWHLTSLAASKTLSIYLAFLIGSSRTTVVLEVDWIYRRTTAVQ